MAVKGVEQLYKNYGILADAGESISDHKEAFEGILAAAKGSNGEKQLVSGFVTKFSRHFPDMSDSVMDTLLDLVEDDEAVIRHNAIKCLPGLCKGDDPSQCTKVADVLTQLLVSEDSTDIALVKSAMATVLQIDVQKSLVGIFDQIMGDDDSVREKAMEYVSVSLMDMRHKLFIPHEENEKFLVELIRKATSDVTGEEFEKFIEVLGKLHHLSRSVDGIQQIIDIITEQAELQGDFQPDTLENVDRFITCFRLALKFCKKGGSSYPFIQYVSLQMLPVLSSVPSEQEQHSVLQLLAEGSLYLLEQDTSDCLPFIYAFLLEHMPLAPEDGVTDTPKLQFSVVECVLFAFHQLVRRNPEFFTATENSERLKEFRVRLQYFARGCQTYHGQLFAALKGKTALELKDEQNKVRQIALKTTANISSLVKDFFHNPPSYKTVVQLSWGAKKVDVPLQAGSKRSTELPTSGAGPSKRKPSPIRFDVKIDSLGSGMGRKQTREIYHPPRDQFSKKVSNGNFPDFETSRGGGGRSWRGRGRGRGRGGAGGGGRSWRV